MNTKIFFILFSVISFNAFALAAQEQKEFNEENSKQLVHEAGLGRIEHIEKLLQKRADINYRDFNFDGFTPLYCAIFYSKLENIRYLLFMGADIDILLNVFSAHVPILTDFVKMNLLRYIEDCILNYDNSRNLLSRYNSKEALISIRDLLKNHQFRFKDLKNKNLSDIVKKVNRALLKRRDKICSVVTLPTVIEDLVLGYLDFYPEDFEGFSKLPEEEVNEIVKIYSEEFEKKNDSEDLVVSATCSIM